MTVVKKTTLSVIKVCCNCPIGLYYLFSFYIYIVTSPLIDKGTYDAAYYCSDSYSCCYFAINVVYWHRARYCAWRHCYYYRAWRNGLYYYLWCGCNVCVVVISMTYVHVLRWHVHYSHLLVVAWMVVYVRRIVGLAECVRCAEHHHSDEHHAKIHLCHCSECFDVVVRTISDF